MKALVTGATGFIGKRLLAELLHPVVLSRNADKAKKALSEFSPTVFAWHAEEEAAPAAAFDGVDTVFHLAGEPVAEGRWTAAKKKRLRDSRTIGTRNLVKTLAALPRKPKVLVSASAVGYYSDRGDEKLTETSPPVNDFLGELCQSWEHEAMEAEKAGIRVVRIRTGIVLGAGGGALVKMLPPIQMGIGGPLGSGKQYMPWVHLDDLVGLMMFTAKNEQTRGAFNGTAPHPVTNRDFTKTLGKVLHRPTFFPPVPGFMLRLLLGEFGQILLHSQNAVPQAALNAGYRFQFPELEPALRNILKK